jgi:protoporphyrin/coproporphyrin ferrochelatase
LIGVLLMSYGSPNTLDEVEEYYTEIRHGRKPSAEEVANLKERYQSIGGRSPLLEITRRQADALERKLNEEGLDARVYVGMKHWEPFIAETMKEIARDPVEKLIAIPLAPHYSKMSIGGYHEAVMKAQAKGGRQFLINLVESWHLQPELLRLWKKLIEDARSEFDGMEDAFVLFTAHSLPERILNEGDPYKQQLYETSSKLAEMATLQHWGFAFQSAGHTAEKWLGPDIIEELVELRKMEKTRVLVAPIGFVADHLEILYDLDIEAMQRAEQIGVMLKRTRLPNDSPLFIEALASLVKSRSESVSEAKVSG